MPKIKIDIVSDVVCPWCPIGFRRLQAAMRELSGQGIDFEIEWQPFELAPDMPNEGEGIVVHLARKYNRSEAETVEAQKHIMATARELGLDYGKALERRAVNTFNAHRVLLWAGEQGRQSEFALALFDAYFGQAKNPADAHVLSRVADALGLDSAVVAEILASDHYAEAVRDRERFFRRMGIHSVPTFIVDRTFLVTGAQEPQVLADVLRRAATQSTIAA